MMDDDRPVGRVLTRREVLVALGASGVAVLARCSGSGPASRSTADSQSPAAAGSGPAANAFSGCVARPEQTEGPYFVDELLHRSDVRSDPTTGEVAPGALLALSFNVSRLDDGACAPLEGAVVDIWQCDHRGVYSDVRDPGFDTVGRKFLRGYQVTDADGLTRFTTIYPGWYPGRTVHIHFKIRSEPTADPGFEFTSQVYFPDDLTDRVHAQEPYAGRGERTVRNDRDGIYRRGGSQLLLAVSPEGEGLAARFDVALQGV
jgi:protocatechuate 3,4-dioxygenase beta subunit